MGLFCSFPYHFIQALSPQPAPTLPSSSYRLTSSPQKRKEQQKWPYLQPLVSYRLLPLSGTAAVSDSNSGSLLHPRNGAYRMAAQQNSLSFLLTWFPGRPGFSVVDAVYNNIFMNISSYHSITYFALCHITLFIFLLWKKTNFHGRVRNAARAWR